MYFRPEEIDFILAAITRMMTQGSCFWFDYVSEDLVEDGTGVKAAEDFMRNMRKMGEPFVNGYNDIGALAEKYHLALEQNIDSGAVLDIQEDIYDHYRFCILKGE